MPPFFHNFAKRMVKVLPGDGLWDDTVKILHGFVTSVVLHANAGGTGHHD
jgi:hypothetical protein